MRDKLRETCEAVYRYQRDILALEDRIDLLLQEIDYLKGKLATARTYLNEGDIAGAGCILGNENA